MTEIILGTLLIFFLRIVDVSIGTFRIVVLMRGQVGLASVLGFLESLTWVAAASVVFANLGDPIRAVAFAAGFGTGVLVGGLVERRIAMGTAFVRIVASVDAEQAAGPLRKAGFLVTVLNAEGRDGDVRVAFLVLPRRKVKEALALVHEINPDAFVTVEEVNLPDLERIRRSSSVRK
jgi:uncharacterized protein YebE (UPF0316 family)